MISLEEYKRAYREIRKEEERRGFLIHLTVYLFVNAMLIAINLTYTPKKIWFFYPLFGWGIGVTMHYLFGWIRYLRKGRQKLSVEQERNVEKINNHNIVLTLPQNFISL
ncbi:MAG: hypothetical protein DRP01_11015 [Archaeoglobales archaeon]|nr:MAG: hypothetical protein DRP01_11015 [Archaeoglobales archaeon]